jgi:uncharacterized membrane protein
MVRQILSVLAGYAIFVVTSLALFRTTGQNPHLMATTSFIILTSVYGAVFSFISGLISQTIAKTRTLTINYILAFVIAAFATFSLLKSEGSHWTQILAILVFAPISIAGGIFFIRRHDR